MDAFHCNDGFIVTPAAPLTGDVRTGTDGGELAATVEKLAMEDHALVPDTFVAFTRQ